jgi:ESCRT-II complex subunit VPS22
MSEKCERFKEALEAFAQKHRHEIVKNPEFRSKFNAMCHSIGVDPLNCETPPPCATRSG